MTKPIINQAGRVSADTLALAAKEGVQRALAARSRMTELTPEQTSQVSGALVAVPTALSPTLIMRPPIIYGLWQPIDVKTLSGLKQLA